MSQPREHPVPCQLCRRSTWNQSAVCSAHKPCMDCGQPVVSGDYCPRHTAGAAINGKAAAA